MSATSPTSPHGRGGRGGHEPRVRIAARERRALELSMDGWTQDQIADDLGVSQAAVSKILQRIERRHFRELAELQDRHKARQALRLEHVYAQAIRAWADSKQNATKRRQRKTQSAAGGGPQSVAEVTTELRHGDPRYLEAARKALSDLRALHGLDAPQKVEMRSPDRFEHLTDDELHTLIREQARDLNPRDTPAEPKTTEVPREE